MHLFEQEFTQLSTFSPANTETKDHERKKNRRMESIRKNEKERGLITWIFFGAEIGA